MIAQPFSAGVPVTLRPESLQGRHNAALSRPSSAPKTGREAGAPGRLWERFHSDPTFDSVPGCHFRSDRKGAIVESVDHQNDCHRPTECKFGTARSLWPNRTGAGEAVPQVGWRQEPATSRTAALRTKARLRPLY